MRSALGVRHWLNNCPVYSPPPASLLFICHPSLLGYRANSPHLASATLVHVIQHQPGLGLIGQNTNTIPAAGLSPSMLHTLIRLLIKDINTAVRGVASHQTCLYLREEDLFLPGQTQIFLRNEHWEKTDSKTSSHSSYCQDSET